MKTLQEGRRAFSRQAWNDAYLRLCEADTRAPLEPADLEATAKAANLTGRDAECERFFARAHSAFLEGGEIERAAECAFWLAFGLMDRGEHARASGWLARAQRVLDEAELECGMRGFLLLPAGLRSMAAGNAEEAYATFARAGEVGARFVNADLQTLALLGCGQASVRTGNVTEGVALMDEAMVAVTAGEVSPIVAGIVYCAVIESCHDIFDLRRAQEWTTALTQWCDAQSGTVQYRGQCLIRRAEIMQVHGLWTDAMDHARRASDFLTEPPGRKAAGAAFYRQAELHRLQGNFAEAEEAYREANQWGRKPNPGLALLRLAQGQIDAAGATIRRVLGEERDWRVRATLLAACVEILIAADDVAGARVAADELSEIADKIDAPFLHARSAHAVGSVLRAEGHLREALATLHTACTAWRELKTPYEAARSQELIGLICRELGDEDSGNMELDAARRGFQQLNAVPDIARLDSYIDAKAAPCGLTPREIQVLGLVATGKTNRAIADHLFISERTVERHVSNIFAKLDVSTRAAATAYAYEHAIV